MSNFLTVDNTNAIDIVDEFLSDIDNNKFNYPNDPDLQTLIQELRNAKDQLSGAEFVQRVQDLSTQYRTALKQIAPENLFDALGYTPLSLTQITS